MRKLVTQIRIHLREELWPVIRLVVSAECRNVVEANDRKYLEASFHYSLLVSEAMSPKRVISPLPVAACATPIAMS